MTPKFMYILWKAAHLCSRHDKIKTDTPAAWQLLAKPRLAATVLESTMQPYKQTYLLTSMASTGTAPHI